jgi:hypothetical protein
MFLNEHRFTECCGAVVRNLISDLEGHKLSWTAMFLVSFRGRSQIMEYYVVIDQSDLFSPPSQSFTVFLPFDVTQNVLLKKNIYMTEVRLYNLHKLYFPP